ncbi:ATP-binding protein [Candidatus Neptunochlamydia vexilliferae]|nr:ATP-binding protein [Candidatus Neptunochlamydia vexilliferae]
MDRELLKQVIADQKDYAFPKTFFDRTQEAVIQKFIDDPSILIISGIRRSGKSTIQRVLQQKLPESDYYLNFDDERLVRFGVEDFQVLLEVFAELFGKQSTFYFDEIQNIDGWEQFVRRLYEKGNKIYITGSNARLLSQELGTHLTGRYIRFEVYPLSFKEIIQHEYPQVLTKKTPTTDDVGMALHHFSDYLKHGGIPEYYKFRKAEYLKDLYEGILYRDIAARYNITNEKPIRELVYYFASNIGKEFSYRKLGEAVGLSSPHTVSNYCDYLEKCYLCFFLSRYSHSLKKQILYNKKCYMIDPALIRTIGFRVSKDRGRLLENIVFLHLKMLGLEVYFHKEKKECDFITRKENRITQAIQVSASLSDEKVKNRELEGLMEAMNAYGLKEGLIITENEQNTLDINSFTVKVIPIWKWLLEL